jgi:hypothetical protein
MIPYIPYPPSRETRIDMALAVQQLRQGGTEDVRCGLVLGVVEDIAARNEAPSALLDLLVLVASLVSDDEENHSIMLHALRLDGESLCTPETDWNERENET